MEKAVNMPASEWYNDPEYWNANRSFIWSGKRIEMSETAASKIAELLGMKPGDSILDMACGFGRHSLAFSKHGYSVTGVDLNPDFIQEATQKAADSGLDARFICADMREYVESDSFDSITIMYNSFGYFPDPEDDRKVLENCLLSLKPGGSLLLQVVSRDSCMRSRNSKRFRYWHEEENGSIRLEEAVANDDWTWNTTRWIILEGAERREYTYGMRLYDSSELGDLLSSVGFSGIKAFGNLSGEPYGSDAHHIVLHVRKPIGDG